MAEHMSIQVTESKIPVYMGNDNPYAALWTLIGAKLFSRPDGTSPARAHVHRGAEPAPLKNEQ
jgi:hypothetical protein